MDGSAKDYRADTSAEGVTLVVRRGHRYGLAGAGDLVIVDARELRNPSTMTACMTLEESERLQAEAKARAEAKAKPAVSPITAAIDAEIKRHAAARAEQLAAEAKAAEAEKPAEPKTKKKG